MLTTHNIDIQAMFVWLTLPFYDFCGFRSVAVNSVYKLQFFTFICGEATTEAMYMKICVVGDVLDVITYAKFQNEIFRGYNFTGGLIFHSSY